MKKLFAFALLIPGACIAQQGHLIVQGSSGNLYLKHAAAAKENFYSIGRIYNISPKEVAPFNHLSLDKGLNLGQELKIPLKENFIQAGDVAADEVAIPIYHRMVAKETLYGLSTQYNKVSPAAVKAWNNLKTDALTPGQELIIGYLKVKKDMSSLAPQGIAMPSVKSEPTLAKVEAPVAEVIKPVVKEVTPKNEIISPAVTKKEETKPEAPVVRAPAPVKEVVRPVSAASSAFTKEGLFKSLYVGDNPEETGKAGVFKSTSGWDDGKYYCLHNKAPRGSILRITNASTGKSVYAKVLDVMPDLKQNAELSVRLSNAAADALGAGSADFDCSIKY